MYTNIQSENRCDVTFRYFNKTRMSHNRRKRGYDDDEGGGYR